MGWLIFDAQIFGRWLENHAVNDLLRQMNFVEADMAFVTRFGLLHGDVKPVLLLHGITAAFVITGLIGLLLQFVIGVMECFTEQSAACRAADNGVGIVVGQLAAEGRAACAQADIGSSSSHGSAARE